MEKLSRRKALAAAGGVGIAMLGHGKRIARAADDGYGAEYSVVSGKNLWEVVEAVIGTPASTLGKSVKSQICFETPFGTICIDVDYATAVVKKTELMGIKLQEAIDATIQTANLRGACTTVCVHGVCVTHCW